MTFSFIIVSRLDYGFIKQLLRKWYMINLFCVVKWILLKSAQSNWRVPCNYFHRAHGQQVSLSYTW